MEIIPIFSFFTGVISILSPCILPILPIFIAFSLKSKSKPELVSFILGLFSIFTLIIFLTGFFTYFVYKYIIYVRIISAIVLFIIGILMLFEYSFSFKPISPKNDNGIIPSFILGFLTSVSWAPCYSAYLVSLITLVISKSPLFAAANIILYCLGFALALAILSYAISKINLEKWIDKTSYIPKIFAILIMIGAVYLFYGSLQVFL
ncbi:cytochrome c biogenesis CcdA family protein [Methanobrevibacter olleyae]|uniref:Cytochrome C-type biogeneis protein DsbD n=1 Tax=Methanobrevibacter olleyae TaxID=294671 RepID=A0A126R100_METOL|nr:cytochrome c biogenesis protein CcdA [Methanobrevibacter olleyae]AMK16050.1 cytochrome C-type biogeneis protein DsbD [Methanobrevibacter olleyae]SFL49927.1 cytochrome c-type biogenesis protein [Methanobrevibacter olleyae]